MNEKKIGKHEIEISGYRDEPGSGEIRVVAVFSYPVLIWYSSDSVYRKSRVVIRVALDVMIEDMAEVVEQEALKEKTDSGNKQEEEKCSIPAEIRGLHRDRVLGCADVVPVLYSVYGTGVEEIKGGLGFVW
ncbi:hypothetical protein Tco_1251483, partial [Tanacetum coccineum]